jgi:diacylglycerol O-acyltransferase
MIRKTLGGTVNDVVLAAITSGFRDLIVARGEDPTAVALRTLVPVSVRVESEHGVPNNRVSALFLDLPVHLRDPQERLSAVRREMGRLKESHESEAGEALTALMGNVPPAVAAQTTRLAARVLTKVQQRRMNTVTTNVPGPPLPLCAVGRKMVSTSRSFRSGRGAHRRCHPVVQRSAAFGVTGDSTRPPTSP